MKNNQVHHAENSTALTEHCYTHDRTEAQFRSYFCLIYSSFGNREDTFSKAMTGSEFCCILILFIWAVLTLVNRFLGKFQKDI